MHTNENVYDTFIPRWFGRLGNNIQQLSNGIYFCEEKGIKFTSPDHPMINAIEIDFGNTQYKIKETSHNWFYFFDGPDADFAADVNGLNFQRKYICEQYILPNLKIDQSLLNDPLPDNHLVIHLRSGDLFTHWPKMHPQNPLVYYMNLINHFKFDVQIITEDMNHPFIQAFQQLKLKIRTVSVEEAFTTLLRARNIATSGVGSFAPAAALCSKNLKRYYCTDLFLKESLNPMMLKEHLEVFMLPVGDKYIRVGDWNYSTETFEKLFNHQENTSFRRL
jgi:hypothetical protein